MKRNHVSGAARALAVLLFVTGCSQQPAEAPDGPYQATGMKIGEVSDTAAIVWTRLTRRPARIGTEAPMPRFLYRAPGVDELQEAPPGRFHPHDWVPVVQYPDGSSIERIEGAVIGSPGEVRVLYRAANTADWLSTDWEAVDPEHDFVRQFSLAGLAAATEYELQVEGRPIGSEAVGSSLDGRLRTAPSPDQPARVVFGSTTGTEYDDQDAPEGGF